MPAIHVECSQACLGTLVVRVYLQCTAIALLGGSEIAPRPGAIRVQQVTSGYGLALTGKHRPNLKIIRLLSRRLLQAGEAHVYLAFRQQLLGFGIRLIFGRAPSKHDQEHGQQNKRPRRSSNLSRRRSGEHLLDIEWQIGNGDSVVVHLIQAVLAIDVFARLDNIVAFRQGKEHLRYLVFDNLPQIFELKRGRRRAAGFFRPRSGEGEEAPTIAREKCRQPEH